MTFSEIQSRVADILNLTSAAAIARIGVSINERYKRLASSIGLQTTVRTTATANTVVGNRSVTFSGEKIYAVYDASVSPVRVLQEISFDEMRNQVIETDPPDEYAIQLMGATTVTIYLDCVPATIYALTADVDMNLATLSGSQVPAFAEDYHDALIMGAMATEYEKMEKPDLAKTKEKQYEERLGQLRLFIALSANKQLYQGKTMGGGSAGGSGASAAAAVDSDGWFNILDYAAVGGGADDTIPIKAATLAASAVHGVVMYPPQAVPWVANGVIPGIASTTQLFLGSDLSGTMSSLANLNMVRLVDGALEMGQGDGMRYRLRTTGRGLFLQGRTVDGNTYYAVGNYPGGGTTNSCGFQAVSGYIDEANYSGIDFEIYPSNAPFPYASIKSRKGSVSGSHYPFLFQIGGNDGPMIEPTGGVLISSPYDGNASGANAPGNYVVGAALQGDMVLGFAATGGRGCWLHAVKANHLTTYRLIGSNFSDQVVLDKDQKGIMSGAGVLLFDADGHLGQEAATGAAKWKDGTASYSAGDTILNCLRGTTFFQITNAAPTTLVPTNFTNFVVGQEITIHFKDANTTVSRAGGTELAGGVNFVSANRAVLKLFYGLDGVWHESYRATTNS